MGAATEKARLPRFSLLLSNACVRVADVMIFTFVSLMPVHNVCRIGILDSLFYDHTYAVQFSSGNRMLL